jgi:hypothetical protein
MVALVGEEDDMKRRHHTPEQIVATQKRDSISLDINGDGLLLR